MRLYFELSPNQEPVPFDYQHYLTGAFHKWLGYNAAHDGLSLYSLSWLTGGKREYGGLTFPNGTTWFISAYEPDVLHKICQSAVNEPGVCCGMEVTSIKIVPEPQVRERQVFKVASPVLAKGKESDGRVQHYLYSDEGSDAILTQTLRHKIDKAGLGDEHKHATVRFDRSYGNARTKLVTIKGIGNRVSLCPVIVEGTPEAVRFAWNVGVGHLTGSGFGALA